MQSLPHVVEEISQFVAVTSTTDIKSLIRIKILRYFFICRVRKVMNNFNIFIDTKFVKNIYLIINSGDKILNIEV